MVVRQTQVPLSNRVCRRNPATYTHRLNELRCSFRLQTFACSQNLVDFLTDIFAVLGVLAQRLERAVPVSHAQSGKNYQAR